jgi:1-acyl-sn-glycerol-3-phosphate acyltransferase
VVPGRWEGLEKIPDEGGALLVANHAGAIPSDAPVIMHGIEKELGRPVYGLADYFFRTVPVVGTLWARPAASPPARQRLPAAQGAGQLVLDFPEGTKGPSKSFTDRYQLRRFGRGGFVEIAMRAGVPVIPIAVTGSEEAMPVLFRFRPWPRRSGSPTSRSPPTSGHGPARDRHALPGQVQAAGPRPRHFDVPPTRSATPRVASWKRPSASAT